MSYQVLARKWRPRDFASLVGQDHVVRALTHALEQKRLHHAYLFTGTRGVGKTTLSRILAKALNCVGPDGSGGITATPCNRCPACEAIDAGRFVDYIEMDAASNRGVDEMTTLLERAVYAPSNARFKVYMIDEVHMLTTHAFNAMLKTLEEPPDYVKFILATTDPQKLPATVLSRCLQFNLKQMPPAAVASLMADILQKEGIAAEPAALKMLGHAARGSMRDGLSLLDQAIAYSAGNVTLEAVRNMLGAIDATTLVRVLDSVVARDAKAALAVADEMAARSFSFAQALRDLATLLHWIALAQRVPDAIGDEVENATEVLRLAQSVAPDEVQLLYQIALHGRNDLHLAPDEYAGFTMTLLRMIAFAPAETATDVPTPAVSAPPAATRSRGAAAAVAAAPAAAAPASAGSARRTGEGSAFDGNWPALVERLKISGMVRELATRSELIAADGNQFRLRVPIRALAEAANLERLKAALAQHFGHPIRVTAEIGATAGPTAAGIAEQVRAEKQKRAEEAIYADPFVKELIENFGATVDPTSIKPNEP
ncbi:MAG: DNA polymerase III subunit gamma/tau [Gemmatimonadota bacterium]